MKRLFACVLLLASLTACAGASAPGGGNCKEGVCVKVQAVEPVRFGEPVTVTVTVTSEKDIPNLGVSLYHDVDVVVEEPQTEEKNRPAWKGQSGVDWIVNAKANQPLTFTRKVRFPPREGVFDIVVSASTPSLRVTDSVYIRLTRAGGKVYLSGTSVPVTSGPLPTVTPGPSPTFIPTPTRGPLPLITPMRSQSPLATPMRSQSPLATPTR